MTMTAYIILEKEKAEKALAEGLAPEGDGIRGVKFSRVKGPYIAAFFHPEEPYVGKDACNECLCAELPDNAVYVADAGRAADKIPDTLVPLEKYKLGTYRRPFIVVTCELTADKLSRRDPDRGLPLLFENSEKLYVDRCYSAAEDSDPGFKERALKAYYESLAASGRAVKRSGTVWDVRENLLTGGEEKKKERGGIFRLFSRQQEGKKARDGEKTGANGVTIAKLAEESCEYVSPDGEIIGISISKGTLTDRTDG